MANLMDYLDWRGDLTLEISPFNEVDALILAELSFVDFDGSCRRPWLLLFFVLPMFPPFLLKS